jgi:tetratricopeptide (TPR) repeat protein
MLRPGLKAALVVAGGIMIFFGFNYGRSELYLDRGNRYRGAQLSFDNVSFYARAKELDPGNPFVRAASAASWRMRVLEGMPPAVQKSFLEKSKEDYEAAYRLYPSDIYIILPLARCLDDLGLHEQAEEKFLEALDWAPLYLYPRLEYAIHLHRLKRFDEAEKAYQAALEGHALQEIHTNVARIQKLQLELAKDRKTAAKEEKAAALNP